MKRRILLSSIALCFAVLGAMAQRSYTFNAVALNVDGLPKEIAGIEINPDAQEETGATNLCNKLANSGWDFIGLSEDFNFHDYLAAAPASDYYNFGEHGGGVSGLSNSTDGLGFACAKYLTMSGGTRVEWGNYNGFTDQGADGLITKGFRVYTVTFATGIAVDVYVLHMDADDGAKDIAARETQLTTLATYIKDNHNNRPVIVLGDTNCRYTREQLKTLFIDVINADPRFTIKDPWVEHMWGGTYPEYGTGSLMTDTYGEKGEVVDKVFYINTTGSKLTLKSNSYLWDKNLEVSDHKPVVVNFTLTDPNGTPAENNWTLEESVIGNKKPKWEGVQVVSGTGYYLMNVGTGEYIKYGGAYYTEAVAGNAAMLITPTSTDGGVSWKLYNSKSSRLVKDTQEQWQLGSGDYTYTDQLGTWYLEPVSGTSYQYRLRNERNLYLSTTPSEAHKPIKSVAGNANDDNQKWIFLTDDRIRTEMTKANADYPFNFTALLKSADFDVIEYEDGWTAKWTGFNQSSGPFMGAGTGWGGDALKYVSYAYANSTSKTEMSQSLGTLPNGTYNISFEGFYRSRYKPSGWFTSEQDETRNAVVSFGSTDIAIPQNTITAIGAGVDVVGPLFRDGDTYLKSQQVTMNSSASVTLKVTKPATSSSAKGAWICIDNFRLIYYGTGEAPKDPYKEYKDKVLAKVNETYPKVMALNAAGQAVYDITVVINRYNNDQITSGAMAQAMCDYVDNAYANALAAHLAAIVQEAIDNMEANEGDITGAIINPSFETGDLSGWTVGEAWDLGAKKTSDGTYAISNSDGNYMFNAWSGDDGHTSSVMQTIKGIPNGLYELKAVLASFGKADGKSHDYHIYLVGNGYHSSVAAVGGKTVGQETTLYFLVENGTATIGAIGGNKGGGTEFIHYWADQGCFFKADDFRLKYICDVPHGRLKLALDEANATKLDAFGQIALDLSSYQAAYDNKSLTTDGKAEVAAIYDALQVAAKAQKTAGADMTWAIENPNFETGDYTGWNVTVQWDTKVGTQESSYKVAGADGRYLFNTWNNADGTNNTNEHITQTVTGIPNGTYRLTAMLSTDGENLELTGNGTTTTIAASTNGNSSGVFPTVECTVTNNTLTIEAGGAGGAWYKADNFHLTLVTPAETPTLFFDHAATTITAIEDITFPRVVLQRPIKAKDSKGNPAWSSFVAPFNIPAFDGWDYMELTGATYNAGTENLSLQFTKVETIEAGVPYMIRCTTLTETLPQIEMGETSVNTVTKNDTKVTITGGNGSTVTFKGVYTAGKVPQGAFFISDNTFYQAGDDSNTIKGFRGYIKIEGSLVNEARSMSLRWNDEGTTGVDAATEEVTTVAIYDTNGVRLSEMQPGINILLMSDGSVVKIMVK